MQGLLSEEHDSKFMWTDKIVIQNEHGALEARPTTLEEEHAGLTLSKR